eukprot:TRINITY_DN3721_c0_g1_i1.p1 TRINITY_DN3721_c0_g1~~TRINITY_DN3721_c0_g1_i1.p1  ORF type:complete len:484 (+),score=140.94 TRINITY_DN3721_c0_g1_i1:54-1454(+)
MTSTVLTLYRSLLRRAKQFDNYPIYKVWCNYPLNSEKWYKPEASLYKEVKRIFREPMNGKIDNSLSIGFNILKKTADISYFATHQLPGSANYFRTWKDPKKIEHKSPFVSLHNKIEPGILLVAHPRENDSWQRKVVVLILQHHPKTGTLGVVLNERFTPNDPENAPDSEYYHQNQWEEEGEEGDEAGEEEKDPQQQEEETFLAVKEETEEYDEDEEEWFEEKEGIIEVPKEYVGSLKDYGALMEYGVYRTLKGPIFFGGIMRGYVVLHSKKEVKDSVAVADGLYHTKFREKDEELMKQIIGPTTTAKDYRLYCGLLDWVEGELEREIETGMWFLVKCPLQYVFTPKLLDQYLNTCPTKISNTETDTSNSNMDLTTDSTTPNTEPLIIQDSPTNLPTVIPPTNTSITPLVPITPLTEISYDFSDHLNSDKLWALLLQCLGGEYSHFSQMASLYPNYLRSPTTVKLEL